MFFGFLKNRLAILLAMTLISFSVIGCGSSDSSSLVDEDPVGEIPVDGDKVVISEENRDQVVSSSVWIVERAFAAGGIYFSGTDPSVRTTVAKSIANFKTIAESQIEQCDESGSYTLDFDETSTGTYVYNECQEYGEIKNGTVTDAWDGNDLTRTYTNYYSKSTSSWSDFEISYESGTLKTTFDDEFSPLSGSIEMTGYIKESGIQTDLENYQFVFKKDGDSLTFSMNGRIKSTPCLDNWIEVETVTDVKMDIINFLASCPIAGEIKVLGGNDSSLTMNFNADKSVDVSINGGSKEHYNSCDDLPDAEGSCS